MTLRRVSKRASKIFLDLVVAAAALWMAAQLRYGGAVPAYLVELLPLAIVVVAIAKTTIIYGLGGHSRIWQYTSMQEMAYLVLGAIGASVLMTVAAAAGWIALPVSLMLIDGALYLVGLSALRMGRRMQVAMPKRWRGHDASRTIPRTLVVGAGDTTNSLLGDLEERNHHPWQVVGLLDDDRAKQGGKLHGHPVLGPTTQLEGFIKRQNVQHVVIAMPSAQKVVLRGLIARAQAAGATVQAIPALEDLLRRGKPATGQLAVTLSDLMDSAEIKRSLLHRVRHREDRETILVTGGAGYIGNHVVRKLLDRGYRVRVLDNFTYGDHGLEGLRRHDNIEMIQGDISSLRDVVAAVKDVDSVIALAAIVGDPACGLNAEETLTLNYESTKVLVEACNFYGVRRLVFASSCSVYGANDSQLLTETSALNPVSLYARTRILSEDVLFERAGDVEPVILRLSTVFGLSPRMRFDLVVNMLTARAVVDGKIQIFGGDQWRPFVHCQDAAEAFLLAVTAPAELVRGEIFNVGSTEMNYTISRVGEIVAEQVGRNVAIDFMDVPEDLRNYRVSFEKIREALGFAPAYSLERGIVEMVEALRDTPALQDYNRTLYSNLKFLKDRFESAGLLSAAER